MQLKYKKFFFKFDSARLLFENLIVFHTAIRVYYNMNITLYKS